MCSIRVDTEAVVYVDDLLVGGKDKEEHDQNLEKGFGSAAQSGNA